MSWYKGAAYMRSPTCRHQRYEIAPSFHYFVIASDCAIVCSTYPLRAQPKELVERLKRLEILAAEKEYRRMVRNVDHEISEQDRLTDIRELKVRLAARAMLTIASVCTVTVTTAPALTLADVPFFCGHAVGQAAGDHVHEPRPIIRGRVGVYILCAACNV
jgi:hypothetical protein